MKLCDIFDCQYDIDVKGIAEDSRLVEDGYIFFATKGYNVDHFDYIDEAIKNGAIAIVCDRKPNFDVDVCILVDNVRSSLIAACEKFYDVKAENFKFIGITGTDGKTTTATLISRLMKAGYIGTNGVDFKDINMTISNTTPTICELYRCLKLLKDKKCKVIVMEVSSEALLHHRVDHIKYDAICYTNITEDHLNIHKNIKNYVAAKRKLLDFVKNNEFVFINGDDKNCQQFLSNDMSAFGFNKNNDYVIKNVKKLSNNVCFEIVHGDKVYNISSPFLEDFNIYNVCLAFIVCMKFGCNVDKLIKDIEKMRPIVGRCERINFGQNYEIVLDYAHTYNAIVGIINNFKNRRKIVVTGAAGGREKEKREKIGEFLLQNCEVVIFTMDDPRFEDVDDIINQMIGKYVSNDNYLRIVDRKKAIFRAFDIADKDDIVLILGKGRDNYMAIEDKKIDYCDYDTVFDYFA